MRSSRFRTSSANDERFEAEWSYDGVFIGTGTAVDAALPEGTREVELTLSSPCGVVARERVLVSVESTALVEDSAPAERSSQRAVLLSHRVDGRVAARLDRVSRWSSHRPG